MSKPPVPYEEIAAEQKSAAVAKDLSAIAKDEEVIAKSREGVKNGILNYLNAACRQGQALRRICGHEQVSFGFIEGLKDKLPWGKDVRTAWETAAARVNLSHTFEGKVLTWDDVPVESRKRILQQAELLKIAERGPANEPVERLEIFARVRVGIVKLKEDYLKSLNEKPLAERSESQLEAFMDDTEWVPQAREQVKELLKSK